MIGVLVAAAVLAQDVTHRELSIEVEGDLLGARFVDVTEDGRSELVLAVRVDATGRRELRIHPLDARGVPAQEPSSVVPVLSDVVAFALADVRPEPGKEVLFLTRAGVWSASPTIDGLRGNIRPLVETELVFDVADPGALPYWRYVLDGPRDLLVVPGAQSFSVYGPPPDGSESELWVPRVDFSSVVSAGERDEHSALRAERGASFSFGGSNVDVEVGDADPRRVLLDNDLASRFSLIALQRSYRAPGLGDVDGDGTDDLLVFARDGLWIHLAVPGGIAEEPTRVEEVPEYAREIDRLDLVDVDGDGDDDLFYLVVDDEDAEGFASEEFTLGVVVNDGGRLFAEQPAQLLRFEAVELRYEIGDVTGDGRPDLVVRKLEMPSMLEAVTSLDFRYTTLVFPGQRKGGRVFDRKPLLKDERVFDEDSLQEVIAARNLSRDLSGDGIADLVEVDANGRVTVRRLLRESSFFGGESWSLERSPWKRFELRGSIGSLAVDDVNGDGIADVASVRGSALLLLLSTRGAR